MKLKTENKLLSNFSVVSLSNIVLLLLAFFLLSSSFVAQPPVSVQEREAEPGEVHTVPNVVQTPAGHHASARPSMSGTVSDSTVPQVPKIRSMEGPAAGKIPVAVATKKVPQRLLQNSKGVASKGVKERAAKRAAATKGKKAGGGRKGK